MGRVEESKKLYARAQYGVGTVFGHSSRIYEDIIAVLAMLGMDKA
jgi:hypothetical protein